METLDAGKVIKAIKLAEQKHGFRSTRLKPNRLALRTGSHLRERLERLEKIGAAQAQLRTAYAKVAARLKAQGVPDRHKLVGLPDEISLHDYLLTYLPEIASRHDYSLKPVGEKLVQLALDASERFHLIMHKSATGIKVTIRGITPSEAVDETYDIPVKTGLMTRLRNLADASQAHSSLFYAYEKSYCKTR